MFLLLPLHDKDGKVGENYYRSLVNAYNKAFKKRKISQHNSYKRKCARMNLSKASNQFDIDMADLGVLANLAVTPMSDSA